jgi:light-regulated signal transduction histidine kinase (bacteriophytochrome)
VIVLLALGLASLLAWLRRVVVRPTERLAGEVREVAAGDLQRHVGTRGPREISSLGRDVEAMRRALVAEMAQIEAARHDLEEAGRELERSNSDLEQFAYVASHDLQEPLRKVASFCELLRRRYAADLDERANQYIDFAVDGATRMQTLIDDLLSFSRVGRVHIEHTEVDLDEVVDAAIGSLSLAIEEAGAEVTRDPLPKVLGNRTQLEMLMQNLLGNAVKFRAPDRPPRIHIEAARDGDRWRLAVRDNGIGIEPQYETKVFAIFQRLHTRNTYPGNGIGLALCKKIVEFHGGTIGIDDQYKQGTRFVFDLPALEPSPQEPESPESQEVSA